MRHCRSKPPSNVRCEKANRTKSANFPRVLIRFANLFTFEIWRKGEGLRAKVLNYQVKLVGGTGIEPVTPPV